MAIPWRSWLTALLVLSGAVLAARAQAPVEPAHDPQLNDPSVDEKLNEQRHGERKAAPVPPSAQAPGHTPRAGASSVLPRPPEGRFLPEGTFLSSRAGVVAASKGGRLVFVPAEKEGATSSESAPLALLPNQRLAQLEATLGGSTEPRLATLSGQVFVYRERSYLLVSVFSLGGDRARNDAAAAGNEPRAPGPEDRADAQALMRELDERSAGPRAMDRGGPGSTIGEERRPRRALSKTPDLLGEGTVLAWRRARLVRGLDGLVLNFDSGTGNGNLAPMPLLRCALTEQLEALAASRGEDVQVKVSGRLTAYAERNYLLPTAYQVVRAGEVRSLQ